MMQSAATAAAGVTPTYDGTPASAPRPTAWTFVGLRFTLFRRRAVARQRDGRILHLLARVGGPVGNSPEEIKLPNTTELDYL
jgi:hypothetical protein